MLVPKFNNAVEAAQWIANSINAETWTKGAFGRGIDNQPWSYGDPEFANSVKFCAIGWIRIANQGFEDRLCNSLYNKIKGSIAEWNDKEERTIEEVREAFKGVVLDLQSR